MLINNKELAARVRFGFMMVILVYLVLMVLSLFVHWENKHLYVIGLSVLFVIGLVLFLMKGYNYIYFNPDGSKIILRYMQLQPFLFESNSIEIPKEQFVQYQLKKSFFGMRTSVVLYQKTDKGLSKYRPVSLESLKTSEKRDMLEVLDRLSV